MLPDTHHDEGHAGQAPRSAGRPASGGMIEGILTDAQRVTLAAICVHQGVVLCYLFGSRASGHADWQSDWDLGVVFETRHPAAERTQRWLALLEAFEAVFPAGQIDLIFLQDVPPGLQFEAIEGKLLYAEDDVARADFEEEVMRRWMDLRPFLEAQERDEEEAIALGYFFVEPEARALADRSGAPVAAAAG